MKTLPVLLVITATLAAFTGGFAADRYQVTGPVLEFTEKMIVVEKDKERWEIALDAGTKLPPALKVGDKVTIHYSMTATSIEVKGASGEKEGGGSAPKKK